VIARVFPTRTNASPVDCHAYFGPPGLFESAVGYTEVHISVLFTWMLPLAEELKRQWERIAPVFIGGPATGMRGEQFEPGRYLKPGYVITSRGCPNKCWFCSVWRREGTIRELEIKDGWNVLDDNLLACSGAHIDAVFEMLKKHKSKVEFTGGLEAARLKDWHIERLLALKPAQMFFAYDEPADEEPLVEAFKKLRVAGFKPRQMRTYVLIGYPKDTIEEAEKRLEFVLRLGSFPMAMLWKNTKGESTLDWRRFQKGWARPAAIGAKLRELVG
jgi:hypothetical protein